MQKYAKRALFRALNKFSLDELPATLSSTQPTTSHIRYAPLSMEDNLKRYNQFRYLRAATLAKNPILTVKYDTGAPIFKKLQGILTGQHPTRTVRSARTKLTPTMRGDVYKTLMEGRNYVPTQSSSYVDSAKSYVDTINSTNSDRLQKINNKLVTDGRSDLQGFDELPGGKFVPGHVGRGINYENLQDILSEVSYTDRNAIRALFSRNNWAGVHTLRIPLIFKARHDKPFVSTWHSANDDMLAAANNKVQQQNVVTKTLPEYSVDYNGNRIEARVHTGKPYTEEDMNLLLGNEPFDLTNLYESMIRSSDLEDMSTYTPNTEDVRDLLQDLGINIRDRAITTVKDLQELNDSFLYKGVNYFPAGQPLTVPGNNSSNPIVKALHEAELSRNANYNPTSFTLSQSITPVGEDAVRNKFVEDIANGTVPDSPFYATPAAKQGVVYSNGRIRPISLSEKAKELPDNGMELIQLTPDDLRVIANRQRESSLKNVESVLERLPVDIQERIRSVIDATRIENVKQRARKFKRLIGEHRSRASSIDNKYYPARVQVPEDVRKYQGNVILSRYERFLDYLLSN